MKVSEAGWNEWRAIAGSGLTEGLSVPETGQGRVRLFV